VPKKPAPDGTPSNMSLRSGNNKRRRETAPGVDPNANDQLLRTLLDGLDEGVANISAAGVVLYANSRFADLLGTRRLETLVGVSLKKFVSPASWDPLDAAFRRGVKTPTEGVMNVETLSASPRTIRLRLRPLHLAKETTISVTATEVTELLEKSRALKDSEASLHSLSARILQLQDQERRRIARDLHDITGQELAVVVMSLNHVANNLGQPGLGVEQAIADAVGLVRKVEDEIRTLSYLLHPPLLDEFGLGSALGWYADGFKKRSGIQVEVQSQPGLPRLSTEKETALFRVVQESLTNVLRHSGSSKAWIRVSFDSASVSLSVEDEGRGIGGNQRPTLTQAINSAGVGILGMRERLQQLGGSLDIRSGASGTQVTAVLPLQGSDAVTVASEPPETMAEPSKAASHSDSRKRILIADDHEVTRRGIRTLLQDEPDLEICGEAQDGVEAVAKTRELNPDLVIMDLTMPRAGGFSAANSIRQSGAPAKILIFTTHSFGDLERMSHKAGFEGFVCKTNAAHDLVRGVRAVLLGNHFYNSEVIQPRST
jgi:two-component system, NarL family, sensor kinase